MKLNKRVRKISFLSMILYIMIILNNISFAGTLSSDISGINENKYPGVKSLIQNLQKNHSNYNFQVYYTGIDWTEAVTMEYQGHGGSPKNLFSVSKNYKGKWYCPICGSKTYDTGWYCASIDAIKYMMDPRNSLDETSVYQFKNLESSDVSSGNIQSVINNKYSSYGYINNPTMINAIVKASSDCKLNGYSILAKIVNEQGKGASPLATGAGYNGQYAGYYNFFNVGAYGNGTSTVITNGLKYAQSKDWNSVEKSVLGGSDYYKSSYIGRGQNTLYYQRFNVVHTASLFSHQYQQDIMGAQTSATLLKNYYTISGTLSSVGHTFIIPLYENMPKQVCSRPSTEQNSNLNCEDATVLTNKLAVRAAPQSGRIISYLNANEKVKVLERASQKSSDGNYWDIIVSQTYGTYGYVVRSGITSKISLPSYVFDLNYYIENNQDIVKSLGKDEQKLLSHFINSGIREGRKSSPTFCVADYKRYNLDLVSAIGNDYMAFYNHFISYGAAEGRKGSSEFDVTFYKNYYSDVTNLSNVKAMEHYVTTGRKAGRLGQMSSDVESIVYNSQIYMSYNQDLARIFGNDAAKFKEHWLKYGMAEGRVASLAFDVNAYKEYNKDLYSAIGTSNQAFFDHFVKYGVNEARRASYLFDITAYKKYNQDLTRAIGNSNKAFYNHFVSYGAAEGRRGADDFDLTFYRYYYSDLTNKNNLELYKHYITSGRNQGRVGGMSLEVEAIVFDAELYKIFNQDLLAVFGNNDYKLKIHWLQYGMNEGRVSSVTYNTKDYKNYNRDLVGAIGNSNRAFFEHFVRYGVNEQRRASIVFDCKTYLAKNSGLKSAYGTNYKMYYLHFANYGINEGRQASNEFNITTYMNRNADLRNVYGAYRKSFGIHYTLYGRYEGRRAV